MKIIASTLLTVCTFLLIIHIKNSESKKTKSTGQKCSVCTEIVKNFVKGIEGTRKSNYGGGNTDWEETRLGEYANSEVRMVEIMEHLCHDASKECHPMLEEHENVVEDFWREGIERSEEKFHNYFCIEKVKACCPNNTYGPDCKECPGGTERPCKDNGKCLGAGTREGSGKCKCTAGYEGKLCDSCKAGYYQSEKNDSHTVCKVCHISCKDSCTGEGPKLCSECKEGWTHNAEIGCQDMNECDTNPCKDTEYCTNTQGSYMCMSCNVACDGCTGSGPDNCVKCSAGYKLQDGKCLDVDECYEDGQLCSEEGQACENTIGSYKCGCQPGYNKIGDTCMPKPQESPKKKQSSSDSQLNRQDENLITLLFAFCALSVIFFVIGKLCYLISPGLVSIPVAVFAIIVFYLINGYD